MIRLVLSNRKTKNIVALLLTAIMIFQLFSSVDWVMVAEAATPDTYTIEGTSHVAELTSELAEIKGSTLPMKPSDYFEVKLIKANGKVNQQLIRKK